MPASVDPKKTGVTAPEATPCFSALDNSSGDGVCPSRNLFTSLSSVSAMASTSRSRAALTSCATSAGTLPCVAIRSTTPLNDASAPMGTWTATQLRPSEFCRESMTCL